HIQQADEQQDQTQAMIRNLEEAKFEFQRERETLEVSITESATQLEELRRELRESETRWDETRALLDSSKDRHNALEIEKIQVESDLQHLSHLCYRELPETVEHPYLSYFDTLPQEELEVREQEY